MILYNITFGIDNNVSKPFVDYLITTIIPASENLGLHSHLLTSVRQGEAQKELYGDNSLSIALQMRAPSQSVVDSFKAQLLPLLAEDIRKQCPMQVVIFDTTLDIIHDQARWNADNNQKTI